jgi:hypothetical protein
MLCEQARKWGNAMTRKTWSVGWRGSLLLSFALVATLFGPGLAGGAPPSESLVWPGDPLTLTSAGDSFTTKFEITNVSDSTQSLQVADGSQNECQVDITSGGSVPLKRTVTVSLVVTPIPSTCPDPADGTHTVVLTDGSSDVALQIRKNAASVEEPEPTGVLWPTDSVFLNRRDGKVTGSFIVVNPTGAVVEVTPPTFADDGCEQVASTSDPISIEPHRAATIPLDGPPNCKKLSSTTITAVASATTADGSKLDGSRLTLEAEVDWGHFGMVFVGALVVAVVSALVCGRIAASKVDGAGFLQPLRIDSSAPTAWLTAIAAVGPLLTALASTSGLPRGLFGTAAVPQQTMIIAASAVGLLLVGVAGLVTGLPTSTAKVDDKDQACPVAAQFLVGAALCAGAAFLQVWAVTTALSRLDLVFLGFRIVGIELVVVTQFLVGGLILVYLGWSAYFYVHSYGAVPPTEPPPVPSNDLVAALQLLKGDMSVSDEELEQTWANASEVARVITKAAEGPAAQVSPLPRRLTQSLI